MTADKNPRSFSGKKPVRIKIRDSSPENFGRGQKSAMPLRKKMAADFCPDLLFFGKGGLHRALWTGFSRAGTVKPVFGPQSCAGRLNNMFPAYRTPTISFSPDFLSNPLPGSMRFEQLRLILLGHGYKRLFSRVVPIRFPAAGAPEIVAASFLG